MTQGGKIPQHTHLMGVCGVGMAAMAGILKELGHRVTGSDEHPYPPMSTFLEGLGVPIMAGYRPENLEPAPDLVVVGNVIRRDNPEAQAMLAGNLPHISLPEALNRYLVGRHQSLVVTGTHGKTTTTAILAWLLFALGMDPGFMVGGIAKNFSANYRVGQGPYVVLEGDEYDTAFFDKRPKFVHFTPRVGVITSMEFDHADIYADINQVYKAFEAFMRRMQVGSRLLAWGDDTTMRSVCMRYGATVQYYGLKEHLYWQAGQIVPVQGGMNFTVYRHRKFWGNFTVPLMGVHNVLNALAALATMGELGVQPHLMAQALEDFRGVKKRQEIHGEFQKVLVIEDFAHHPSAVAATLKGVREAYPGRRLLAVFEPRTNTSRRKIFQQPYAESFGDADVVLIREPSDLWKVPPEEQFSAFQLVKDLVAQDKKAFYFPDTDKLLNGLLRGLEHDDVVLIMSNGDFDHLVPRLCQALGGKYREGQPEKLPVISDQ
jgi:UDP-N-acetylmuramate: L-alanyl-gamma-D-glutamyl-meso-diaminopimelate ligase